MPRGKAGFFGGQSPEDRRASFELQKRVEAEVESVAAQLANYVLKSGDTMTGSLSTTGSFSANGNVSAGSNLIAANNLSVGNDVIANGRVVPGGTLDLQGIPNGAAARRIRYGNGYELFSDNAGPGSANSRLWFQSPNGGAIYLGPRAGGSILDLVSLQATTINASGRYFENGIRVVERSDIGGVGVVRLSDGTMIQQQRFLAGQTIPSAYGGFGLFIGSRSITFPVPFVGQPSVAIGAARWGTGASWGNTYAISSTSFLIRLYDVVARTTTTPSTEFAWIATGRWS